MIIPDKVATIDYAAFWECGGFRGYLKLGKSITKIGALVFVRDVRGNYVSKLYFSKIYCAATAVPTAKFNYGDISGWENPWEKSGYTIVDPRDCTTFLSTKDVDNGELLPSLVVPIGCKEKYEASRGWGSIFAIIEEADF